MAMSGSRTYQASMLFNLIEDIEAELGDKVHERLAEPYILDGKGNVVAINRDQLLFDVLREYFMLEFDWYATMEVLCSNYGIDNPYAEE